MGRHSKLLRYAAPYRGRILLLFVLAIFLAAVSALVPWPMKLVVDSVLRHAPLPTAVSSGFKTLSISSDPLTVLAVMVVAGVFVFLLSALLNAAIDWGWTSVGRRT